ncbi:MAG TPA: hypothetical protein VG755_43805 [Nannocystaceae bacterium]|nr:hypothetical protein [Nannocystaceae bacterium]
MRRVRAGGLIALALALALGCGGAEPSASAEQSIAIAAAAPTRAVPGGPVRTSTWTRATDEQIAATIAALEHVVRTEALADPDETWMLAHAVAALGPAVELASGGTAVDAMLAIAGADGRVEGVSKSGLARDPHPDHTLATLLAAGVSAQRLHAAMVASFTPPAAWGERAWTMRAIAEGRALGLPAPAGADPRAFAAALVDASSFLEAARAAGAPVRKRKQGIWAEPCGGLHWIEAVAAWTRVEPELRPQLERVRDVLQYRVGVEADLYAQLRAAAPPELAVPLDAQELKFFGHVLDAARELERADAALDPAVLDEARARLCAAVRRLAGTLARLAELRASDPQLYRDLVGDAAHALAGLRPPG